MIQLSKVQDQLDKEINLVNFIHLIVLTNNYKLYKRAL